MKHNKKVVGIMLAMFLIVQLLGLVVINFYLNEDNVLPYGFEDNREQVKEPGVYGQFLGSFLISLVIAILLIFILMKIKLNWVFKTWFFVVVCLTLGVTFNVFLSLMGLPFSAYIAILIGVVIAYFKVIKRNIIVHNLSELLIYPGIGAIFSVMFNIWTAIAVLIIFSVYDMWAVWKSGFMIKMAKYQMNNLGVFGGLLIPYANKKIKDRIKLLKIKFKNKEIPQAVIKKNKIKINVGILGGGDLFFPLMATGVFYKTTGNLPATLIVVLFSTLALGLLFLFGNSKKAYPALPFLTGGLFVGMLIGWLITLI